MEFMIANRTALAICLLLAAGNVVTAVRDLMTRGYYMTEWMPSDGWAIGGLMTLNSALFTMWLILSLRGSDSQRWAKAALALILVGPFVWHSITFPAFFTGAGRDECYYNCLGESAWIARADIGQTQLAVAIANFAAFICLLVASRRTWKPQLAF
jgi:hypothetical protein